jgi:hypothetical protein
VSGDDEQNVGSIGEKVSLCLGSFKRNSRSLHAILIVGLGFFEGLRSKEYECERLEEHTHR